MITDKLLAFADHKKIEGTSVTSEVVELDPKQGDEIARTLNLVCQLDDCKGALPTDATITPKLQQDRGAGYADILTFPAVSVAQAIAGKRLINFAKLPLGGLGGNMRIVLTLSKALTTDTYFSAWLTSSVEA